MKKLSIVFLFLLCNTALWAAWIEHCPVTVTQPDGTEIHCFVTGDEYYQRVCDSAGYTLIRDPQSGWVMYAFVRNDSLLPSGYRVGAVDPTTLGLTPNQDISPSLKTAIRQQFWDNTPKQKKSFSPLNGTNTRTGTLNNIVIYIRFADEPEYTRIRKNVEIYFNDTAKGQSLYSYYRDISNGQFHIISTFFPETTDTLILSYQDTNVRAYYQPYDQTTNPIGYTDYEERSKREQFLLHNALLAVQSQIEAQFSTAQLDYNGDNLVDNICFVIKGNVGDWRALLWPHRWSLFHTEDYLNGVRVYDYNLILENHLLGTGNGKQSVLIHETYHTLGAPDLYRYENNSITPVGGWDIMAENTIPPQSSTVFISETYGQFIEPVSEITTAGTYTVYQIWDRTPGHNIGYKIALPNNPNEYIYVEYRKKTGQIYESNTPGTGLIFYRVNTTIDGNGGGPPDQVYIFRPYAYNNETQGLLVSAYFSALFRSGFSDSSNPPCFLSDNSPCGNIYIDSISHSGSDSMTFRIHFLRTQINSPSSEKVKIYPNPAQGLLYIDLQGKSASKTVLYNLLGIKVFETSENDSVITINTADYPAGSYVVRIFCGDEIITQKIIISD
ncbi:MAG: T9SS type A sorting domain-containing protein [Bacteroidales bacterium]|jgi:M6 family metalloprotease-like protein|nr:T9SS type A sorting domain-containing protein [Bacteroidales bacterium]